MEKKVFDVVGGKTYYSYSIENEKIRIEVLDYGATLVRCVLKDRNVDVVQGFDTVSGYQKDVKYMGQTIGRVCNRIGKGVFDLNGETFVLPVNNNGNTLHGGINGFDTKTFDVQMKEDQIICCAKSADGEEGFPGELTIVVTYRLLNNGWAFETDCTSTKDTLCSITNHSFFNLNGCTSSTAMDHEVQIFAQGFSGVDPDGLTMEEVLPVADTPFDFRTPHVIGTRIEEDNEQLKNGSGYDHNYTIDGTGMRTAAIVKGSAAEMEVRTDLPCMHLYSANFLSGHHHGKEGACYPRRSALCFETQYHPNAIQYKKPQPPILRAGEHMHHVSEFRYR